jgi:hypothetical protein
VTDSEQVVMWACAVVSATGAFAWVIAAATVLKGHAVLRGAGVFLGSLCAVASARAVLAASGAVAAGPLATAALVNTGFVTAAAVVFGLAKYHAGTVQRATPADGSSRHRALSVG